MHVKIDRWVSYDWRGTCCLWPRVTMEKDVFFKQKKNAVEITNLFKWEMWSQRGWIWAVKRTRVGLRQKWIHREGKQWKTGKEQKTVFLLSPEGPEMWEPLTSLSFYPSRPLQVIFKREPAAEKTPGLWAVTVLNILPILMYIFFLKSACPGGLHESISIRLHPAQTKGLRLPALPCFVCVLSVFFSRASKNAPVEKYKKKQP